MQPHRSPRMRSLGGLVIALGLTVTILLLAPGVALAHVACNPPEGPTWVLQEYLLAQPGADVGAPSADGSTVYWATNSGGDYDIFARDIAGSEKLLVGGPGNQFDPCASHGFVAYVDDTSGAAMIWGADAANSGTPFPISSGPGEHPATDGTYVVWQTPNTFGNSCIMGYDIATKQEFVVCDAEGAQINPAISDGVVVWQDDRNGNWDIYGYDIAQQRDIRVAVGEADQTNPAIFSGIAVWQTDLFGNWDIDGAYLMECVDGGGPSAAPAAAPARARLGCHPPESDGELFHVTRAWGDQTDPSINGPLVVWTDTRNGAENADIYGYGLEQEYEFPVCTADGAQTSSSASGQLVAWLDGRTGGDHPDVYAATWAAGGDEENPPATDEWTSDSLIKLFLSVFDQFGVFSDVRFSFDGGTTWTDWQPFADVDQVQLPEGDGPKTISFQFKDEAGNETPVITITVYLDTCGPTTVTPMVGHATRGGTGLIRFKVKDALSPKADVTIQVRNHAGKVVKVMKLSKAPTNRVLAKKWSCHLRRGTYRYRVLATDLAGNHQVKAGSNRLLVR
jgi:beta propeller repeat protein